MAAPIFESCCNRWRRWLSRRYIQSARNRIVGADSPKGLLNTCYAYSTNGLLVQKRWPEHYTGAAVSAEG